MAKSKATSGSKKATIIAFIVQAIVVIMAAVLVTGYLITGTWNFTQWGGYVKPDNREVIAVSSEGEAMREGGTYAIPAGITFFSTTSEQNATNAKTARAATSATTTEFITGKTLVLTPTLSNEYINGEFDWSLDYASDLAPDDNISGAVDTNFTITPSDDGRQAVLTYKSKLFNVPIELTVKLRGTDSSYTCVLSCMKTVQSFDVSLNFNCMNDMASFCSKFKASDGGVEIPDVSFTGLLIEFTEDFKTAVQKYLTFDITFAAAHIDCTKSPITISKDYFLSIRDDSNTYYDIDFDYALNYSDFIKDFDNYDQAHKEAIYFAWHYVWENRITGIKNVIVEANFNCSYMGQKYTTVTGYGESYMDVAENDSTVTPNVSLNGNYVFG